MRGMKSLRRALLSISVLALPVLAFATSEGSIASPSGSAASGPMRVKGTLARISDGERYWLVVRKGNLLWPKLRIRSEASWEAMIEEPTPAGGRFSIVLFAVTPRADQQLQAWLDTGRLTRSYPPFEAIPGGEELDAVDVKVR